VPTAIASNLLLALLLSAACSCGGDGETAQDVSSSDKRAEASERTRGNEVVSSRRSSDGPRAGASAPISGSSAAPNAPNAGTPPPPSSRMTGPVPGGVAVSGRWKGTLEGFESSPSETVDLEPLNVSYELSADGFMLVGAGPQAGLELATVGLAFADPMLGSNLAWRVEELITKAPDRLRMAALSRSESSAGGSLSQLQTRRFYNFSLLAEGETPQQAFTRSTIISAGSKLDLFIYQVETFNFGDGFTSGSSETVVSRRGTLTRE